MLKDGATIGATSASGRVPITEALVETIANTPEEHRPRAGNITIVADSLTVSGARTVGGSGKWSWVPTTIKAGATGMNGKCIPGSE